MTQNVLDQRLNAFRDDLADARLADMVVAQRYAEGELAVVTASHADVFARPQIASGLQTQLLFGHAVRIFEDRSGWSWVQDETDSYVGYVQSDHLKRGTNTPTHVVRAPRTFTYPSPDLKLPRTGQLSIGSKLTIVDQVEDRGTHYAVLADGRHVIDKHLMGIGDWQSDPIEVADTLMHAPYLWGGKTGFGLDCSGLVQLSHMLCGNTVLRDSDMQARSIGGEIEPDWSALQRGDLVFWKGHVGMMRDAETLIHANAHTMNVALEPLAAAIERIGYLYGDPVGIRRP
ncbi:MAG: NlpC/P60 family protein [Ahrensia sp.]|nr:NlpC/P60 family protein [Ahrensia sp.]